MEFNVLTSNLSVLYCWSAAQNVTQPYNSAQLESKIEIKVEIMADNQGRSHDRIQGKNYGIQTLHSNQMTTTRVKVETKIKVEIQI